MLRTDVKTLSTFKDCPLSLPLFHGRVSTFEHLLVLLHWLIYDVLVFAGLRTHALTGKNILLTAIVFILALMVILPNLVSKGRLEYMPGSAC